MIQIKTTLEKLGQALAKIDEVGTSSFDGSDGEFSVKGVSGRFDFSKATGLLQIIIDDKLFLVPMEMIETEVKKFFQ